jgi:hypothetical protein
MAPGWTGGTTRDERIGNRFSNRSRHLPVPGAVFFCACPERPRGHRANATSTNASGGIVKGSQMR